MLRVCVLINVGNNAAKQSGEKEKKGDDIKQKKN